MTLRLVVALVLGLAFVLPGCKAKVQSRETVGELQVVHSEVKVGGRDVRGVVRLSSNDVVLTGPDGRARLRLDDGTGVILDRGTRVTLGEKGVSLDEGRAFVIGGEVARTEVTAGGAATVASANTLALERRPDRTTLHVASGEAVVRASGKQAQVKSGETATATGDRIDVGPEKAFNDWTGGMAAPWSASGPPRGAIGELFALSAGEEDPGAPLAIRAHDVNARIEGEVAVTRVETTYFNGGGATGETDFRMALPAGAVVSRFAVRRGERIEEGSLREAKAGASASPATLAWAGSGWARGRVAGVPSGETVAVIIEYVEWLSPAAGRITYRYPMVGEGPSPLIGEFHAKIAVSGARAKRIAVGSGAVVGPDGVELRRADFRPQADLVVEAEEPEGFSPRNVRAYVVSAPDGDRSRDAYLVARADLPPAESGSGVALALVVDASFSVSPSELDSARAVVEGIVEGLGPNDSVAVFAADQTTRPVGPDGGGPVDDARRRSVKDGLVRLKPGGATDLGAALERAAGALPRDKAASMVVYVGDGWPTVGDTDMQAIRNRLGRRAEGVPRIGAVLLGASPNRYGLVALSARSGPILHVTDRVSAARAAVSLLATALEPAVERVTLDLGAGVDRLYPRAASAHALGTTVTAVGRVRGALPKTATLRYRRGVALEEEERPVVAVQPEESDDVRRRWAAARVEEISLDGIGLETAIDAAMRARLLTPWTVWATGSEGTDEVHVADLAERVLDLESTDDVPFTSRLSPAASRSGAVLEPRPGARGPDGLEQAIVSSGQRTIDRAMTGVRKCRDLRAALRPEITGTLRVRISLDGGGRVTTVTVRSTEPRQDDALLNRCIEVLLSNLSFFDGEKPVSFEHVLNLPPPRDPRKTRCSPASRFPLLVRRGIWRARLSRAPEVAAVLRARQGCELKTAIDQRAFVELFLERVRGGLERVTLARELEDAGEAEAAVLFRRAAVRDATTPEELEQIRASLVGDEPHPGAEFRKKYEAARGDTDRLAVVRRFLRLSPHDAMLRRRVLALLEALGKKDELSNEARALREDPFADAALLADAASALRRTGNADEGLRAFGEIIERAPRDPYARALVGDRLRDEGLFDDASRAYEALAALLPGEAAVSMRTALAHAGAGRLDVATRILRRVAETGGNGDEAYLGELAAVTSAVLLADARSRPGSDAVGLERRALEIPLPDARGVLLVRGPSLAEPVKALVAERANEGGEPARGGTAPAWVAPSMGIAAAAVERGSKGLRLRLARPAEPEPARAVTVRVDLLVLGDDRKPGRLVARDVELPADGKEVVLEWNGETFL